MFMRRKKKANMTKFLPDGSNELEQVTFESAAENVNVASQMMATKQVRGYVIQKLSAISQIY